MAEWAKALAWNDDRTFPAGFEPHLGKNFLIGTLAIPFTPLASVFRMRQ